MSDLAVVGTVLIALLVPGVALGLCLGLRRSTAVFTAPALTFGLVTAVASVSSYVDLPWNPWAFLGYAVVACGVALLARAAIARVRTAPAADAGTGTTASGRRRWGVSRADLVIVAGV